MSASLAIGNELADAMGDFFADPLGWAMYAFPWDTDPTIQIVEMSEKYQKKFGLKYGLDVWACEMLEDMGRHIRGNGFDGKNAVSPFLQAISSGHGIGKSTITAIVILFIMSTRPHCKGIVTASTSSQLNTKTWAELGKWLKRCITGHWFDYTNGKGNMKLVHKHFPESWRCDGQTCREENSEAFAGNHSVNSSPFYIFDEASGVPDRIWEVAEGGMTDGEPFWFSFGNPTRNTGRFRECFRKFRHRWKNKIVDSRTVQITNKDKIDQWEKDYGESSDFFKIRVRGEFPSQSSRQFISEALVDEARGRSLHENQYNFAPVILTCDPAWEGDDELVIGMRQGLKFQILETIPKNDNDILMAQKLASYEEKYKASAVFIDGGYGTGIVSAGRTMGRQWQIIWFSGASGDEGFLNKRAEMWGGIVSWLQDGGVLPDDDQLYYDLISPETVPRMDGKIQLESKSDMKKRGLPSPNKADALALSFALPVTTSLSKFKFKRRSVA
ncbi:MAG: terminase [Pseudomonadota bacterium]